MSSYSIDRRCLTNYTKATHETGIQAPICFLCGCIHLYKDVLPEHRRSNQHNKTASKIQWRTPLCNDNDSFFNLTREQTQEQYGLSTYLEKYNSDKGGYLNLTTAVEEFKDWTIDIPFTGGDVRIICCPEDRMCSDTCLKGKHLCAECQTPICTICQLYLMKERPTLCPIA